MLLNLWNQRNHKCHVFYGQRVMDIPDGLPKWLGLNNESDLLEDSPPELVRESERKRRQNGPSSLRRERMSKNDQEVWGSLSIELNKTKQ